MRKVICSLDELIEFIGELPYEDQKNVILKSVPQKQVEEHLKQHKDLITLAESVRKNSVVYSKTLNTYACLNCMVLKSGYKGFFEDADHKPDCANLIAKRVLED